jgi:hypothetical protein
MIKGHNIDSREYTNILYHNHIEEMQFIKKIIIETNKRIIEIENEIKKIIEETKNN